MKLIPFLYILAFMQATVFAQGSKAVPKSAGSNRCEKGLKIAYAAISSVYGNFATVYRQNPNLKVPDGPLNRIEKHILVVLEAIADLRTDEKSATLWATVAQEVSRIQQLQQKLFDKNGKAFTYANVVTLAKQIDTLYSACEDERPRSRRRQA